MAETPRQTPTVTTPATPVTDCEGSADARTATAPTAAAMPVPPCEIPVENGDARALTSTLATSATTPTASNDLAASESEPPSPGEGVCGTGSTGGEPIPSQPDLTQEQRDFLPLSHFAEIDWQ